jgi:Transthyretin-like protein
MTKLTTHVLDVYSGKPGKDILVELFYLNNSERKKINSIKLNDDGRANSPLVEGEMFVKVNMN